MEEKLKELLKKSKQVTYLLETMEDMDIDDNYVKKIMLIINEDLDYAIDWLDKIICDHWE